MAQPLQEIDWYGKYEASIMAAVAISLMVWHHMFGFREYLIGDNSWNPILSVGGIEIERMIAAFGKICVSIFAFNTGYVVWKYRERYKSLRSNLRRAIAFLISYWMVLLLFLAYGAIASQPLPDVHIFLRNLIGLSTDPQAPYVNVAFAWYVAYYLLFLGISPLLISLFSGRVISDIVLIALSLLIPFPSIMSPLPMGCLGIIFSKYRIFNYLSSYIINCPTGVLVFGVVLIAILRQSSQLTGLQCFMWGG